MAESILNANRISTNCTAFYKFELQDRVKNITELQEALQNTQANGTKQKLIVCLKVALLAAFVAGSVLSIVFGGPIGTVLGAMSLLPFVIMSAIVFMNAKDSIETIEKKSPNPFSCPWYLELQ